MSACVPGEEGVNGEAEEQRQGDTDKGAKAAGFDGVVGVVGVVGVADVRRENSVENAEDREGMENLDIVWLGIQKKPTVGKPKREMECDFKMGLKSITCKGVLLLCALRVSCFAK